MGRLENKVAIVTGAASGIGRTIALVFAKEGAKVVVADCNVSGGEETVSMIKEKVGEAIFIRADVTSSVDVKNMVKATVDVYGKLNVLVNNAGIHEKVNVPIHECTEEDFDRVIAVNLKGVFLCMKYAIPEMIKAGGGSIINQGSSTCVLGIPKYPAYSASKGGVATLTHQVAVDYLKQNIRVNYTMPGVIATPIITEDKLHGDTEALNRLRSSQPLGRFGTEEEVANLILFLASDESSYITATGIRVDGGNTQGSKYFIPIMEE